MFTQKMHGEPIIAPQEDLAWFSNSKEKHGKIGFPSGGKKYIKIAIAKPMFSNVIILGSKLCKQELKNKRRKTFSFYSQRPTWSQNWKGLRARRRKNIVKQIGGSARKGHPLSLLLSSNLTEKNSTVLHWR